MRLRCEYPHLKVNTGAELLQVYSYAKHRAALELYKCTKIYSRVPAQRDKLLQRPEPSQSLLTEIGSTC